jgi:hypothetical protein
MVRSIAARVITLAVALAAAALPLTASAQDAAGAAPAVYHYATTVTPVYGSPYPIAGHLDLEIFPDGILRGYYHNAYQKAFVPVVGGRDGNYIWFDIGPSPVDLGLGVYQGGKFHVVATMGSDNSFRGQIYPELNGIQMSGGNPNTGGQSQTSAVPVAEATASDQYIFAAKPVKKSSEDYPGM